jgi:hypothetical protein
VTKLPEPTFSAAEPPGLCDTVASLDPDLQRIVDEYGYPQFWNRPNTFESFVWFILEQQIIQHVGPRLRAMPVSAIWEVQTTP